MKLPASNRSFGKTLAVATIALMISSAASAQAQQDRRGRDRCVHSVRVRPAVRVRMVPPVYPVPNGGRPYRDNRMEREATRARRLQTIGALNSQLAILVRARQAQVAAQKQLAPRTYQGALQGAPTMSQAARASQERAGQQMQGTLMRDLKTVTRPNDSSATPKPTCTLLISGSYCY
ncbi:MAG TPA: hypothetical protein VK638_52960 [Edaphobacter sp.]|nr:hypothetical protein [Edaphobacter sp.]